MGAGHGGPSGRYEAWRDEARVLAFLLTTERLDLVGRSGLHRNPLIARRLGRCHAASRRALSRRPRPRAAGHRLPGLA